MHGNVSRLSHLGMENGGTLILAVSVFLVNYVTKSLPKTTIGGKDIVLVK